MAGRGVARAARLGVPGLGVSPLAARRRAAAAASGSASGSGAAPRPAPAEDARTLVALGSSGVLSTLGAGGFPEGSSVSYSSSGLELPVFSFSRLSAHTRNLERDPRASLTVLAGGFEGADDARVTMTGRVEPLTSEEEAAKAREAFMARHPEAFWTDFGDFRWFQMTSLERVHLVGGFARAHSLKPGEFCNAAVDPVAQFSAPVCRHMNEDHADANLACARHFLGLDASAAEMCSVDRLGVDLRVTLAGSGERTKARLAFPAPAEDRKAVKDRIVALTRSAAAASSAPEKA